MNIKDIFKKFVDVGNNADPTGTAGYDVNGGFNATTPSPAAQTQQTVDSIKQSTSSILGGAPKLSLGGKTFGATPTVTSPLKQTTPIIPPKSTASKKPVTPTYRVDPKERPKLAIKRNTDKDKKDVKVPEIHAFGAGDTKFTPDEPIKSIEPVSYYGAGSATQDIVTGKKTAPKIKSYSALADKGNVDTSAYYSANAPETHGMVFPTAEAHDAYAPKKKWIPGNIDLNDRNTGLYDEDGKIMTVDTIGIEDDGYEVVIPTVVFKDGKWTKLSDDEAEAWYHETGEHLGKFLDRDEATAYATRLHEQQDEMYGDKGEQVSETPSPFQKAEPKEEALSIFDAEATKEEIGDLRVERKKIEDEYNELRERIMTGKIGKDYTAEDFNRFSELEAQLRDYDDRINTLGAGADEAEEALWDEYNTLGNRILDGSASEDDRARYKDLQDLLVNGGAKDVATEVAFEKIMADQRHINLLHNIEQYAYTVAGGADLDYDGFSRTYTNGHDQLEKELKDVGVRYGEDSPEYAALQRYIKKYEDTGRQAEVKYARRRSTQYSDALDSSLVSIYGGLMETDEYKETVEKGREALRKMQGGTTRFEREYGRASELQQEFLLYLIGKDGFDAVKKFRASEIGKLLTASIAGNIYADQIENDSTLWRTAAILGNTAFTGMGHTFSGGEAYYKGLTGKDKDDPKDTDLGGGYTISDATDDYLRRELGTGVENDQFKMFAEIGGIYLDQDAANEDWYKDLMKNGSLYQRRAMGYVYYALNGDLEATKSVWDMLKEREQTLWDVVKKGSNRVPISGDDMLYSLYEDYLRLGDGTLPAAVGALETGKVGPAQMLHQVGLSMAEQIIPWAVGKGVGEIFQAFGAGRKLVAGASRLSTNAVMGASIGGRSYYDALDQGADRGSALGYGTTDAAIEFVVGNILDGAGSAAGKLTGHVRDRVISAISNPIIRAVADLGIRGGGEYLEEYIQRSVEPLVNLWISDDTFMEALNQVAFGGDEASLENFLKTLVEPDRIYAGLLGFLSSVGMGAVNVPSDIRHNRFYSLYGKALNDAGAVDKAADIVLNNKVSGPDSNSEAYEAAAKTAEIVKKGGHVSDLAAGKMVSDFKRAGGDTTMLENPLTLVYNKESLTYDDYLAGATSVLAAEGADVALAESLAKLATGQEITPEAQKLINDSKVASQIAEQFKGDLDMSDNKSALTVAARASTIFGALNKVFQTLQNENTEQTVVSPATQQLLEIGTFEVEEAQKIGSVIDKVLNGEQITAEEAKLVQASSPAIRGVVLNTLGLELSEYANTQGVMTTLNQLAKTVADIKDKQAGVKQGAMPAAQARGAAMQGGLQNGIQGSNLGQSGGDVGSGQEGPQGAAAASGGVGASEEAPAHRSGTGQRSGQGQRNAGQVHGEVTEERKQDVKRKAVELGADEVVFKPGEDSRCYYDPDTGRYVIQLRTDGQFTIEQYGLHEPVHLWITYALTPEHRMEVLDDFYYKFAERFGSEFCEKLFNFIKQVYGDKGYLASDATDAMYQIIEDMLSFCFAGQNYGMDLSACRQFAEQFVEEHGLKDIGTGNFSSPKVQEALANGWIDEEYYARRGWSEEDDGTTLDISPGEEAPAEQTQQEEAKPEKATNEFEDRGRLDALKKMRKNLAKQRKLLVDRAKTTGDNKKSSPNYEAHRAKVDALDEQLKEFDARIAELENKQHSADYEEETYGKTLDKGTGGTVQQVGKNAQGSGAQKGVGQGVSGTGVQGKKPSGAQKAVSDIWLAVENSGIRQAYINAIEDNGGYVVEDKDVPEEFRGVTELVRALAPGVELTYYVGDANQSGAFIVDEDMADGVHHGGIFINLASLESPKYSHLDLKHVTPRHEAAHFFLYTAPGYDGDNASAAYELLNYLIDELDVRDPSGEAFALVKNKFDRIRRRYSEESEEMQIEETLVDLFAGAMESFENNENERLLVQSILRDWFEENTAYNRAVDEDYGRQYSADYDPEYYQSIGLIDTDGSTAAFTDNINGVHEDIINQLNGHPGEDVTDFIARGGVRVKPNYGIEINGKTALTAAQYDMIENIVANFSGDTFGIDFVIDGAHMNPEVFEGEDIDPNRVRSFLRNYYERRKANKARDEKLERYSDILGMPVKTMEDAYNLAQMMIQMEGPDPELQEIVDTYDQRRFSADYADDVYNELVGNGYYSVNTPELDKMAEDFDTAWIVSTGEIEDVKAWDKYHAEDGATDLQDNPITNDVQKFFAAAQSIGRAGDALLPGVIPLFLATDTLGFSSYDPAGKSDDHRSIFLTDDYLVGTSYGRNGKMSVDMKALGAMREHIAQELGYENFEDLPLPTDLWQADDYATLAKMYNAALSFKGKTRWVDRDGLVPLRIGPVEFVFPEELRLHRKSIDSDLTTIKEGLGHFADELAKIPFGEASNYQFEVIEGIAQVRYLLDEAQDMFRLVASRDTPTQPEADELLKVFNLIDEPITEILNSLTHLRWEGKEYKGVADSAQEFVATIAFPAIQKVIDPLEEAITHPGQFIDINGNEVLPADVLKLLAFSGNWAVYANTTNPLVLYGDGQNWNHLEDLLEIGATDAEWAGDFWEWYETNPYKKWDNSVGTRHIANYAYERGYDSVIITDIYDVGGYGDIDTHRPSNIYVVFNPNQIKSVNNKHPSEDSRMNYSADYLNPESEDYLGPDLDPSVYENAAVDDAYRNKLWINENEEAAEEELSESSLDADILDADLDAFLARLAAEKEAGNIPKERMDAIWAEYLEKQPKYMNGTKNAPVPEKAEAKKPVIPPAKKAEPETAKPAQTSPEKSELAELAEKIAAQSEDNLDPELLNQAVEAMNRGEAEYAKTLERTELAAQATVQAAEELKKSKAELEKKEQKLAEKEKPVIPPAEKSKPKNEAIVLKNDGTKFSKKDKNLNYARKIGKASSIEIRRRRNDRNTFDVRFNDGTGKIVAYEDVSPSALIKAFAYATGDKETAKQRAGQAMALASEPSLAWNIVKNEKIEKAPYVKPEEVRDRDNYGRRVPVKLTEFLKNSAIRTDKGALINVYRLAPANGVHNNKLNNKLSIYTERAAPINTMRGMTGAAAFGQTGKGVSEQLAIWLRMAADPETSPKELEKIRQRIVAVEKLMREYTNGVTRLDSNRPGFEFATPENAVNGKTLVEAYLDIRKPKVIDAKGKGVDFIRSEVQKFIRDPANKAGLFDADKNPVGPHDGFKFTNVRVLPEGETLGGGEADLDTAYVTLRNNQAKSTYNTAPTDSDFIQYSADYDPAFVIQDYGFNGGLRNTGIVRKAKPGELSDVKGNYISEEQDELFENAKVFDKNGNLRFGIIPLYHGSEHIHMYWDKSRAGKVEALFLSTNPLVSLTYAPNYFPKTENVIDLMRYEKVARRIADTLGLELDDLSSTYDLKEALKSVSDPEAQRDLAEMIAAQYNAIAGEDVPEAWPMGNNGKIVDVKLDGGFDREELRSQLQQSYSEALSIADDISDYVTGNYEPDLLSYLTDLESVLNSASDVFSALKYKDDADIRMAANYLEQNLRYLMDSYAGSAYDETGLKDAAHRAILNMKRTLEDQMQYVGSTTVVYENGVEEDIQNVPDPLPQAGVTVGYANTSDPFVVDGGHKNWQDIDMRGHPQFDDFMKWKRTTDMDLWTPENSPFTRTDEIVQYAIDRGYNSVMIHDIMDATGRIMEIGGYNAGYGDVYIVFNSNQYKSVNNRTPTEDQRHNYSADYAGVNTGYTEGTLEDTIVKILMDKDLDHATAALAEFVATFLQTGVLPQMENEQTLNVFQPKIGESQRALLEERLRKDIEKYGEIEPGETPAREIHFPKANESGRISKGWRTIAESKNTPERMVPHVMREIVQNDEVVYQRITDKAAIAYADREMEKKGFDRVRAEWQGKLDQDKGITKKDLACAELVMIEAAKAGDYDTALTTAAEIVDVGTNAGQVVQAFRLLKKMPASYQLYYFQRVAQRLNRQYSKRIKSGKMNEIKIDREYAKAVINANTQEDLDAAVDALIGHIASQIKATMSDKWNAWRYLAMLGNPKTHIRNFVGNAIFVPAKFGKDLIKAGLESVIVKDPSERSTSLKGLLSAPSEYRKLAERDYEGIKQDLQAGGKYNPTNAVMEKRTIFGNKYVEWLRRANGKALEAEDGAYLKFHYVNSLTNFLATRGMSVAQLEGTKEGAKVMNAARQYAFQEALKATYRDASAIASALNTFKRSNPTGGVLLDGLLPFTKTPINILKRGVEYSPIGLLNAVTINSYKLKNGDISASEFCDNLAAGLTGTGVALLGFWLASIGKLRGGDDDDDKKNDMDKLVGYQNYSINVGDTNYTIDWAAPTALPLFVGAAFFEELSEKNELSFADIANATTVIAEPLTQLSMLSGINDALKSAKWDENPLTSVLASMASGYASQGLPTFFAQIARTATEDRRTTYVDKNSDIPQAIQRWAQTNVMGKIPGANNKRAEYIDAWGRTDTERNALIRLIDNMFSPGYRNKIEITSVDEELMRLSKETGTSVLMSPADRYITFNNEKHNLTAEQYKTYATVRGERTFEMLGELFNSAAYQDGMSEAEKAKAVEYIKQYGTVLGKQAVFPEYETDTDGWAEKCDGDTQRLLNMAMAKAKASEMGITAGNNGNFYRMVMESNWMTAYDQGAIMSQQYTTTSETVYTRKNGPTYELTPERKDTLYEYYRLTFPSYYLQLVGTREWQSADVEKRLEMLEKLRKDVGGIAKAWLAEQLYAAGAAQYVKPKK